MVIYQDDAKNHGIKYSTAKRGEDDKDREGGKKGFFYLGELEWNG